MLKKLFVLQNKFRRVVFAQSLSSSINVIATSVPTVFTESRFDPKLDLIKCAPQSKQLFGLTPKYILPADLRYALPNRGLPEFAFVGRSNAGKSSLINCLLGGKKLVRSSKEAGCTKSINYFALCKKKGVNTDSHSAYLVDLPGYGFAKKSKSEQIEWMHIIDSYFAFREPTVLRRVFLLIDSRRGMMDSDLDMLQTLNTAGLPYQIVFTKSDLVNNTELAVNLQRTFEAMGRHVGSTCFPYVHVVSVTKNVGIQHLQWAIGGIYGNKNKEVIEGEVVGIDRGIN